MREIKFRAWQKYHEKMLEVTGITLDDNGKLESVHTFHPYQTPKRIVYSKWRDDFWLYDKEGESSLELMQYTGLKDKSGTDIYEGDIYHMGDPNITYTVVWHDTGLIGKQNGSNSYAGLSHWKDRIEVIGNIYENPELLEEGEEQ